MKACAGTEVGAPTCVACSSTLSNCVACSDENTCTSCDENYVLDTAKKCKAVFTEFQGVKALPDSELGSFTNPDGATSLTVSASTHTYIRTCSPIVILPFFFSQIVQLLGLWQSSDALGGPGRWAYAGAYQANEAAKQAVVEAYTRQYLFNSACSRSTDASNTYHFAFFACDYLPDVVGKDIAFDPSVDTTVPRVGTIKLVRKDFTWEEGF